MRFLSIAAVILANVVIIAQTQQRPTDGSIQGIVQSDNVPIPGVTITAINNSNGEKVSTSTDLKGQYHIAVPQGSYTLETSMPAFAPSNKQAAVDDQQRLLRLDFNLTLASRSQQTSAPPSPPSVLEAAELSSCNCSKLQPRKQRRGNSRMN